MHLRKLSVFILDADKLLPAERTRLNPERQKKLAYFADLLSQYAISYMFCIPREEVKVSKNSRGAPFLPDYSGFGISKSYAGRYAVCALSTSKVGIDVERLRIPNMRLAKKYFSKSELQDIFKKQNPSQNDYLLAKNDVEICRRWTEVWTLKEAYGKFLGLGLSGVWPTDLSIKSICGINQLEICSIPIDSKYCCNVIARDGPPQIFRLTEV